MIDEYKFTSLSIFSMDDKFSVLITEAESTRGKEKSGKGENRKGAGPPKEHKMENLSESHVELDSRLLSDLLTGVNRAFPFVSSTEVDDIIEVQRPILFRLVHSNNFNVGVQASIKSLPRTKLSVTDSIVLCAEIYANHLKNFLFQAYTEMQALASHVHPSVAAMAGTILFGALILFIMVTH
ncbi:CCAAT-binding factor [Euphorbia peplus]|nr:CCAAT-binding factor [Euphorbia peplus]